jgi:hypothetical protein
LEEKESETASVKGQRHSGFDGKVHIRAMIAGYEGIWSVFPF